eukprot:Sspe_Gene.71162::Locus_42140_Transcript_1_1_Confidence_1.000_Length_571::g.71162::m.71162
MSHVRKHVEFGNMEPVPDGHTTRRSTVYSAKSGMSPPASPMRGFALHSPKRHSLSSEKRRGSDALPYPEHAVTGEDTLLCSPDPLDQDLWEETFVPLLPTRSICWAITDFVFLGGAAFLLVCALLLPYVEGVRGRGEPTAHTTTLTIFDLRSGALSGTRSSVDMSEVERAALA